MISEKLNLHLGDYVKITRMVAKDIEETSSGYILDFSDNFALLHEAGDFTLDGYMVLPVSQIKKIRHNKFDKYFKQIMIAEGEAAKVGIHYKIDLSNWQSLFESIKSAKLNIIVECENPDIDTFTIGPILETTHNQLLMQNFDAVGILEDEPVDINFEDITKVKFDGRYINVFSKYLRKKRTKNKV